MPSPRVTVSTLAAMKGRGERIACLTCYDATFTRLLERAGVDVLLVGDSLGMVLQGQETTVPVTLDQMVYHCACVARRRERALLIGDMPFLSYATPERALATAGRLMQEGGVHMVKLEGGAALVETVAALTTQGVPVCGHLGLLPQSVHKLGGYRFQGRDAAVRPVHPRRCRWPCKTAGAGLLVLECVPAALAAEIAGAPGHPGHRHRRRGRLRRPGPGPARHARAQHGPPAELQQGLPRRAQRRRGRGPGILCAGGQGRDLPRARADPGLSTGRHRHPPVPNPGASPWN